MFVLINTYGLVNGFRATMDGETVSVQQPIPCRQRTPPAPEQVYSYQKYNDQEVS